MYRHVLFGGPGTGKTKTLLSFLKHELEDVPVSKIAFMSYTRQGTQQGVGIAKELFDLVENECTYFKTLHAIAFHELGMDKTQIIQAYDVSVLSKTLGFEVDEYYNVLSLERNNIKVAAEYLRSHNIDGVKLKFFSENYKAYKEVTKKYDFDDLLELVLRKNINLDIDVGFVDEAQDLTSLQWKATECLLSNAKRVYIAGDPNQAIYDWAGADHLYFLTMKADKLEVLNTSYRLPYKIWELAKRVKDGMENGAPYPSKYREELGEIYMIEDLDAVSFVEEETYLFLTRAVYQQQKIVAFLKSKGLPFISQTGGKCSKKKLKRVIDAVVNKVEDTEWGKLSSLEEWVNKCNWEDKDYYADIIKSNNWKRLPATIRVASVHTTKGTEADNVIYTMDTTKTIYTSALTNLDSELRVAYVAITRARKRLYLVRSSSKYENLIYKLGGDLIDTNLRTYS